MTLYCVLYSVWTIQVQMNNINIYLEILNIISLTQGDLEDFHRGNISSQASQALLTAAPNPNQ